MATGFVKLETASDKDPNNHTVTTIWGRDRALSLKRHAQLKRQPVHLYYPLDQTHRSCNLLEVDSFVNREEFVMHFGEEHILLPQCPSMVDLMIYHGHVPLVDDEPITVNSSMLAEYMAYLFTLMVPNMTVTVAPHTSLDLLSKSANFKVTKMMMTGLQVKMIKQSYDRTRYAANALNDVLIDRKRKGTELPNPLPYFGRPRSYTPQSLPPPPPALPPPLPTPLPRSSAEQAYMPSLPRYSPTSPASSPTPSDYSPTSSAYPRDLTNTYFSPTNFIRQPPVGTDSSYHRDT